MEPTTKGSGRYKVFFHRGEELTLKTKATRGVAWIDGDGLHVSGDDESIVVAGRDITAVDLFRLHGLGRVVRVDYRGGRLFVSVIRLMVGQFAVINFLKTGALRDKAAQLVQKKP